MATAQAARKTTKTATKRVSLVVKAPEAKEVVVSGEFNGWAKDQIRLSANGNGQWQATLDLPPGEYQYRLLIDGEWRDHPEAQKRLPNPFGTENCVLVVS